MNTLLGRANRFWHECWAHEKNTYNISLKEPSRNGHQEIVTNLHTYKCKFSHKRVQQFAKGVIIQRKQQTSKKSDKMSPQRAVLSQQTL